MSVVQAKEKPWWTMPRTPVEANIEKSVLNYARFYNVLCLKLNVQGRVGWPDTLYIYDKRVLFIEFKRKGEKPRPTQVYVHGELAKRGIMVQVVDTVELGVKVIDKFMRGEI